MPWLTPIVFKQATETLMELPKFGDGQKAVRFRHIVHAYRDKAVPVNTAIQEITFDTIRRATHFCESDYRVACVAVTFPEDTDLLPAGVVGAPNLERVVTDVGSFALPRPLPLIFDILRNGTLAPVSWPDVKDEVEFIVLTSRVYNLPPHEP